MFRCFVRETQMTINTQAVVGCCIATAYHQRDWCPDTSIYEVYDDFKTIIEYANENIQWCGLVLDKPIAEADVAWAIWGMDEDAFSEFQKEMAE